MRTGLTVMIVIVSLHFYFISCSINKQLTGKSENVISKISVDLDSLNEEGLYGPPDGLRALDFKFCIPVKDEFKNEVEQIDPSIKIYSGNGSKQGCGEGEYLCIGNTHQQDFKEKLIKLASLDYIIRIDRMIWE